MFWTYVQTKYGNAILMKFPREMYKMFPHTYQMPIEFPTNTNIGHVSVIPKLNGSLMEWANVMTSYLMGVYL